MSVKDVLNWTGDSSDLSPDDCGCLDWCYLAGGSTWNMLCCSFRCWRRFNRCWTEMCVCVGGGRPGAGTQFCSGHKPQREPRRVKNSRQVNNNNLICISNFEAAVCLVQRPMCSEVTLKYYVQLKFVETSLMWGNSAAYFSCISWRWSLSLDRPGGAKPRLKPAENPVDGECSSLTETDKVTTWTLAALSVHIFLGEQASGAHLPQCLWKTRTTGSFLDLREGKEKPSLWAL